MTNEQLKTMRDRAETWLRLTRGGPVDITRAIALAEENTALDVLDLIAEVGRLRGLNDAWAESARTSLAEMDAAVAERDALRIALRTALIEVCAIALAYIDPDWDLNGEVRARVSELRKLVTP